MLRTLTKAAAQRNAGGFPVDNNTKKVTMAVLFSGDKIYEQSDLDDDIRIQTV